MKISKSIKTLQAIWDRNDKVIGEEEGNIERGAYRSKPQLRHLKRLKAENAAIGDALDILEAIDNVQRGIF